MGKRGSKSRGATNIGLDGTWMFIKTYFWLDFKLVMTTAHGHTVSADDVWTGQMMGSLCE